MSQRFSNRRWSRRSALVFECLETRRLLAGDILAHMDGQMLVLWGDAADNGVVLTYNSTSQAFRVSGQDAGGSPTTINGLDTSLPANVVEFSGVRSVYVGLNGGNDNLQVGSEEAVDTVIEKWLTIDMGDGDDTVVLGASGNEAGGSSPVARSLDVGTSLNVTLGAGNDVMSLGNADIGLMLNVQAGDGDDQVAFDTRFTPAGATEATVFPVRVARNATISLGGGADELLVQDAAIRGSLTVLDGAGAADITLSNVNARKRIDIRTSDDADQISLQSVRAKQLSLNSNGGIDNVVVTDSKFTMLNLKLGAARDHLEIRHSRTSLAAHIDGGSGNATLVSSANALHGQWRRHFG